MFVLRDNPCLSLMSMEKMPTIQITLAMNSFFLPPPQLFYGSVVGDGLMPAYPIFKISFQDVLAPYFSFWQYLKIFSLGLWNLCKFDKATTRKYHKLGGLNNRILFVSQFKARNQKSRCW